MSNKSNYKSNNMSNKSNNKPNKPNTHNKCTTHNQCNVTCPTTRSRRQWRTNCTPPTPPNKAPQRCTRFVSNKTHRTFAWRLIHNPGSSKSSPHWTSYLHTQH